MKKTMTGLRTTIYKVPDLPAAKSWYAKAFETEPYFDESYYVGFNIGGYELGLLPDDTPASEKKDNVTAYRAAEEIEKEYKKFIGLGATGHEKPTNVGGDIVVAAVKDPWGNVIGLICNPEFKLPE